MKDLKLTAIQRGRVAMILEQRGPVNDVRHWIKLLDRIEFTETELAGLKKEANGGIGWDELKLIPDKVVALEDAQCTVLLDRLNKFEPTPSEMRTWFGDILGQLTA